MDIHKPKPWHGVREFLKEYVIIVVGVLTALGAEQVVEWLHWQHEVEAAKVAFRRELHIDAANATVQIASWPCEQKRLDELSAALRQTTGQWKGQRFDYEGRKAAFIAPSRGWATVSWDEYKTDGAVQHMDDDERRRFNMIYGLIGTGLAHWSQQQDEASAELAVLADDLPLSDVTRENKLNAIEKARFAGFFLDRVGRQLLPLLAKAGVTLTDADRRALVPMACAARYTNTPGAAGR